MEIIIKNWKNARRSKVIKNFLYLLKFFRAPKLDSNSGDPGDSLMTMMKQMYETGDDEMKRTIRKAWHESQSKKSEFSPTNC